MDHTHEPQLTINISTSSVVKVLAILIGLAVLFALRDIIFLLVVAFVIASALNPWVSALQRKKIPRFIAALLIFVIFLGVAGGVMALLVPPLVTEMNGMIQNFPSYVNGLITSFHHFREMSNTSGLLTGGNVSISSVQSSLGKIASGIFGSVISLFGGFFSFIIVIVIAFYALLEENAFKRFIRTVLPAKYDKFVFDRMSLAQQRLQQWLRGQLILCLIIGVVSYFGLLVLGIKYSLVLALWAGLTEFIPMVGPTLGAIPAVFIAFTTGSVVKAVLVIVLYFIVQQLENNFLVPKVMEKSTGLNPLVVMISMLVGGKIYGLVGMLLAIPVALMVKVFAEDLFTHKNQGKS